MATGDILAKLRRELDQGITSEVQVVYLLAGIRKILERDGLSEKYAALKFHCDWGLHPHLDRAGAKEVLDRFDCAHELLRGDIKFHDLPRGLRAEIRRISQMKQFRNELAEFLAAYALPPLTRHRADGWIHFLHLYARVIEDIPLVVALPRERSRKSRGERRRNAPKYISRVTVRCDVASETVEFAGREDVLFRLRWIVDDKNGQSGEIFVVNSFEATENNQ